MRGWSIRRTSSCASVQQYVARDVAAKNRWLVVVRLRPVRITPQTTALQHPGFPGRPSCSRIESEACVHSHQCAMTLLCVLVPQVFTGLYSVEDDCLWWLFCTGNHHSHRHLKGGDALWCNSGKNQGLCACAVLGGASVFLLETSMCVIQWCCVPIEILQTNLMTTMTSYTHFF